MELHNILSADRTLCAVSCQSKKKTLEILSETFADSLGLDPLVVLENLSQREKLGCTGIGHGVAIPHARMHGLDRLSAVLMTTADKVDFDAIDNQPVDIFFAMLVPEDNAQGHLQTLASIASKFNDKQMRVLLRGSNNQQELRQRFLADS